MLTILIPQDQNKYWRDNAYNPQDQNKYWRDNAHNPHSLGPK